ncbi:MAG: hypothetical protein P0S96_07755 [Simkaniaceae bacterium]|nr:hypothetical protein [Candidatus Sacchlamyda saccharinae]
MHIQPMNSLTFWNDIGSKKEFEDPFFLKRVQPFITFDSKIVEYGCGYGRILRELFSEGCRNVSGFDIAEKKIERGKGI